MRQLFAHWFGAVVWNVISVPILFALRNEGADMEPFLRWILPAFVACGVFILVRAVIQTARVRRFRNLRLELDPFPGSIGGQVGGSVELPLRPGIGMSARATLHCIHSYMSGSGKNRRRREDVVWSAEVVPEVERAGTGTRLRFTFDVPEAELPESGEEGDDYHYWATHIAAELPGADLDQSFVVPVYGVEPPLQAARPFVPSEADAFDLGDRGIEVERSGAGLRLVYQRRRYGGTGFGLVAFGAVFLGSGMFIFGATAGSGGLGAIGLAFGALFLVVFGTVGTLLVLFGLHMLLNSLTVDVDGGMIRSTRSYGLFSSTSEAPVADLARIEAKVTMQSGQGSSAKTSYTLRGILTSGKRIALGDGIRGAYLLDQIRSLLEDETGVGVDVALRKRLG